MHKNIQTVSAATGGDQEHLDSSSPALLLLAVKEPDQGNPNWDSREGHYPVNFR